MPESDNPPPFNEDVSNDQQQEDEVTDDQQQTSDVRDNQQQTSDVRDNPEQDEPRFLADVPTYNVTQIYSSVISADGVMQFQIQNFFNFFTSTMFWLSFIPLYERLFPIFVEKENSTSPSDKFGFADVPNFNVTTIYEETYLPDTIAIQLLQNFFNWFTGTVVWFPLMVLYDRLFPIFSPANNQRSLDDGDPCSDALILLSDRLVMFLRVFADFSDEIQW